MRIQPWSIPAEWEAIIICWLEYIVASGVSQETVVTRRTHVNQMVRYLSKSPSEVTFRDITEWLASKTWKLETRRSYVNSLRNFFSWAESTGHVIGVASMLPRVKRVKPPPRPCPRSIINTTIAKVEARIVLMLELAANAGLRVGEIARLRGTDAYMTEGGWSLVIHGKGAKKRILPVVESLGVRISSHGQQYVFPNSNGGHLSPRWISKLLGKVLPDEWTAHSLRHRFATDLWKTTHDLLTVQQFMGHESPETTRQYIYVENDDLRNSLASFETQVLSRSNATMCP